MDSYLIFLIKSEQVEIAHKIVRHAAVAIRKTNPNPMESASHPWQQRIFISIISILVLVSLRKHSAVMRIFHLKKPNISMVFIYGKDFKFTYENQLPYFLTKI